VLSPYTAVISYLLNVLHLGPKEIGQALQQEYHLDPRETTSKKISDRISYLRKNNLIPVPAVNAANGNMLALNAGDPRAALPAPGCMTCPYSRC